MKLTHQQLRALAQTGAKARVAELNAEIRQLQLAFQVLQDLTIHKPRMAKVHKPKRAQRTWTKAQRREAAKRMQAYWASRRRSQLKKVD